MITTNEREALSDIAAGYRAMFSAAEMFYEAGDYRDAKTVLRALIMSALRAKWLRTAKRDNAKDEHPHKFAQRLRAEKRIGKQTYSLLATVTRQPELNAQTIERLMAGARVALFKLQK